jgi:cytoskeleton protein RodZ
MAAEAGGDSRAGIGTRLRAAREKKGLTILQAAEKLHLDSRILESLEAEDFAALGAAVYARGHLRHYAELVGERPLELQELYANSTRAAPAQPDLKRIPRVQPEGDRGKLAGPAMVVLVGIALTGTLWWLLSSGDKPQPTLVQNSLQGSSAGRQAVPANDARPGNLETAADARAGNNTAAELATPATQPGQSAAPPGNRAKGVPSPAAASKSETAAAATAATGAGMVSTAAGPTFAARPKDGELTLKFSSDSWAEVYDASGQRLFYDVGTASSAHTVKGPPPMRVVLGNAAGVALEFNGRPALAPANVRPDGSARFVVNAHGRAVPAHPADDGD